MNIQPISQRGKRQRIGSVCFNGNHLAFFAGYHDCGNCGAKGKLLISVDELRTLTRMTTSIKAPVGIRVTQRLMRHYNIT